MMVRGVWMGLRGDEILVLRLGAVIYALANISWRPIHLRK